jgi:hypothetical protein
LEKKSLYVLKNYFPLLQQSSSILQRWNK